MSITPAAINFTSEYETIKLDLKLLTPMFGGGVASYEGEMPRNIDPPKDSEEAEAIKLAIARAHRHKPYDKQTPIRGTAVRGALRHWWRATTGAWEENTSAMRDNELALFGGITKDSPVPSSIQVSVKCNNLRHTPFEFTKPSRGKYFPTIRGQEGIAYGAFPLAQGKQELGENAGTLHQLHGKFCLQVQFSKNKKKEVKLALSAFVHFGGIGGRTTRGFGQLAETSTSGELFTRDELFEIISKQGPPALGDTVGAIRGDWFYRVPYDRPNALNQALNHLRAFRQAPGEGRRHPSDEAREANKPAGRSYWPEPDEVRRLTNRRSRKHSQTLTQAKAFPRARFGLPIIAHFMGRGEPDDTSIQPKGLERMRSPLQISVDENGYSYLVLTAPDARKMTLTLNGAPRSPDITAKLTNAERQALARDNQLLFNHVDEHGEYDAVLAFLDYVKSTQA